MERMMRCIGQCQIVDNGKEAVEAFPKALRQGEPFDLVTLDVLMPGKDGTETLLDMLEMEESPSPQAVHYYNGYRGIGQRCHGYRGAGWRQRLCHQADRQDYIKPKAGQVWPPHSLCVDTLTRHH